MQSYPLDSFWCWAAVHVACIFIACAARMAVGSRQELIARLAFVAALLALGMMAIIEQLCGFGSWHVTGAMLVAMVIASVSDFSHTCETSGGFSYR